MTTTQEKYCNIANKSFFMRKFWFSILLLCFSFIFLPNSLQAQYKNLTQSDSTHSPQQVGQVQKLNSSKKESPAYRLFLGGGIGGGYSTYSSHIQMTPVFGYRITPKVQIGTNLTYLYQWSKDLAGNKYNSNIYGGSLFLRYIFWKFLYVQAEYEILSVPDYYSTDASARRTVKSPFAGLGFIQVLSERSFFTVSVLHDFLNDKYSPYSNPLIRVSFAFGL